MELSILGIGSVSAVGCGADSLRAALEGSVRPRVEPATVDGESGQPGLPFYSASVGDLERFVPRRALRRIDRFTRMALLASYLTLEDSGVKIEDTSRVGIVFGTSYGPLETTFRYQDTIIDDGDKGASPTLFANSVHNAPASQVSIFMKIEGPCLTLTNFELTTTEVLRTATIWLKQGTVDYVLAGVGDEYSPVLGYALRRLGAGTSERIDPVRFDQCSYVPGEGFVTFLLGRKAAKQPYGSIRAIAVQRDASDFGQELIGSHRAVFLSANGDRRSGRLYERLKPLGPTVAAYSPLYGSTPIGLGFDLALAAISCRAGRLYPCATRRSEPGFNLLTEEAPLRSGERIGCLEISPRHTTLISIARC